MELKTSPKGIPYIEFDEETRIAFTKITPGDRGFKWVTIRSTKKSYIGKARKEITERADFVADISLKMPQGFNSEILTKKKLVFIRKLLKDNMNGNGFLPEIAIPSIAEAISNYKERRDRSDKGKPRKKTRKVKKVTLIRTDENGDVQVFEADRNGNVKAVQKKEKEKERELKKAEKAMRKREKEIKEIEKKLNKPKRLKKEKSTKTVENKLGRICRSCANELFLTSSCNSTMLVGHGKRWSPIVHKGKKPCVSCGVMAGGRHHLYCPVEECPRCGKKMMKCGCFK
jgi:hypothetical protein